MKPVNDDELLSINFTLPGGFGYVLADVHCNIVQNRAVDWTGNGFLLLTDIDNAHRDFDYKIPLEFPSFSNAATSNDARATRIPAGTLPRIPITPSGELITSMRFANTSDTVASAGVVNAVVSFWEYDLEQMVYFAAHMAMNTVTR